MIKPDLRLRPPARPRLVRQVSRVETACCCQFTLADPTFLFLLSLCVCIRLCLDNRTDFYAEYRYWLSGRIRPPSKIFHQGYHAKQCSTSGTDCTACGVGKYKDSALAGHAATSVRARRNHLAQCLQSSVSAPLLSAGLVKPMSLLLSNCGRILSLSPTIARTFSHHVPTWRTVHIVPDRHVPGSSRSEQLQVVRLPGGPVHSFFSGYSAHRHVG